jgi:predicted RNase H-like HicB family nuclease
MMTTTMSEIPEAYTVRIHAEDGHELWAEVTELPGCFASGDTMPELRAALSEAISLYLSEPGHEVHVELYDEPGSESVTERRLLARTAALQRRADQWFPEPVASP